MLIPAGQALAQNASQQVRTDIQKMSPQEMKQAQSEFDEKYPFFGKVMTFDPTPADFPSARPNVFGYGDSAEGDVPLMLRPSVTLWGDVALLFSWADDDPRYGYYSITASNPVNFAQLSNTTTFHIAPMGVQYKDGHIYGFRAESALLGLNYYISDYNTKTGVVRSTRVRGHSDPDLVAFETAQAPDGTTYGAFWSADGQSRELGVVDYSTSSPSRTTIGSLSRTYVALGMTSDNQLYGIATNGYLYKINTETAEETSVGPTGLTISNANGQYYGQTGEIDQKDDTFYWLAITINGRMGLYTVDLQTGHATQIGTFSGQVYGMVIPYDQAVSAAPDRVASASIDIGITDMSGTLNFTAPTTTYGDSTVALTGSLGYKLYDESYANYADSVVVSGTTTPGATVSTPVTFNEKGLHKLSLVVSNDSGVSPKYRFNIVVGYDSPQPVTNLAAVKDANDKQVVNISWNAPTLGAEQGTIDASNLTYEVLRRGSSSNRSTVLASGLTATSFSDTIPYVSQESYRYGVRAYTDTLQSTINWMENGIIIGDSVVVDDNGWVIPNDGFTADNFAQFTVIDGNNDGNTWYIYESYGDLFGPTGGDSNDDWLITPPLYLNSDNLYYATYTIHSRSNHDPNNTFEVKAGNAATAEAMTTTVQETVQLPSRIGDLTYRREINPTTTGNYYIGFHENTPRYGNGIRLDDLSVTKGEFRDAPDSVTNFVVNIGERGALRTELSFNVAKARINGRGFDRVDSIQIFRDGNQIATLGPRTAGESVLYTDNDGDITTGNHTYDVVTWLNGHQGRWGNRVRYVGDDTPTDPQNVKLINHESTIEAQWDELPDTGANNGYVNPQEATVSIYTTTGTSSRPRLGSLLVTSDPGATNVSIAQNPEKSVSDSTSTFQELYMLMARSDYKDFHSGNVTATTVVGPTVQLPYKESVRDGHNRNLLWTESNDQFTNRSYAAPWRINHDASQDNDGGSNIWSPFIYTSMYGQSYYYLVAGDESSINTPKISIRGAANPKLYFYVGATENDEAKLKVLVGKPDRTDEEVAEYDLSTFTPGWHLESIDLGKYTSENFIFIKFRGIATGENASVSIDNINVFDQQPYNLAAVNLITPKSVNAGKSFQVGASVENFGANAARNYSVVLYSDDQPVDTITVDKELGTIVTDTVTFTYSVPINADYDSINLRAQVVYDLDLDEDDNTTVTKSVIVNPSEYTKINDLTAGLAEKGVSLNWTKPVAPVPETVTEDFDQYDPFTQQFGDWTTVNGDEGNAGSFFSNYSYPGQGSPMSYLIFNPNAITDVFNVIQSNPGMAPHSGDQFAGAPYSLDPNSFWGAKVDANNWLISPELPGTAQTVTFWVFNIAEEGRRGVTVDTETFDVLYSTVADPTDTTKFVKITDAAADGNTPITEGPNWKQVSVELPDSAKFFAIRQNTVADDQFLFGVDDVTFTKLTSGASDSIVGYNIYRDEELVGTTNGNALTYTDADADEGAHVYNVTILYQRANGDINESGFSNDASITVTGIENVKANVQGTYDVYTIDGKTVMKNAKSLNGLGRGVYIINDRKYIIK